MTPEQFRQRLLDAGLLAETSVAGIYLRAESFERVVRGAEGYLAGRDDVPERHRFYFPPIMPRTVLEASDYFVSFPDLVGVVAGFLGSEADHRALLQRASDDTDWVAALDLTEVALCSAACHPIYPIAARAEVPVAGIRYEVQGTCFRHEPSTDPARMQSFRQHEYVFVGGADGATAHRDEWLRRGVELLSHLGLEVSVEVANDPFFGRAGRMLRAGQRDRELKFEIVTSATSEQPTAIASGNCHEDHFGTKFGIRTTDGASAHSACIGFGLERITLALFYRHGLEVAHWPEQVRTRLGWPAVATSHR